ncbi:hypothetical protein Tco_0503049 [Tanacetum coccineum]
MVMAVVKERGDGLLLVVVLLWWCCGGVVVGLWWCCGGLVVVVWCCGGGVVPVVGGVDAAVCGCYLVGVVFWNMENYEDDPVTLTCRTEVTLANKLSCELTRVAEQMRIREIHTTMLHAMPLTSLNTYGLHALLMTHESDIRITHNLRTTRDELLRSIAEKQKFIAIRSKCLKANASQLLIGLDDVFSSVRNIILTTDSLPDVKYAFATLSRDESHRTMQTREPFSISDHKTVSIGDIIHLESFPLIVRVLQGTREIDEAAKTKESAESVRITDETKTLGSTSSRKDLDNYGSDGKKLFLGVTVPKHISESQPFVPRGA